jgi:hypothetical protein
MIHCKAYRCNVCKKKAPGHYKNRCPDKQLGWGNGWQMTSRVERRKEKKIRKKLAKKWVEEAQKGREEEEADLNFDEELDVVIV